MALPILAVLLFPLICAAQQPAENPIYSSTNDGSLAAVALKLALLPAHLNTTRPDAPTRDPRATALLLALLESFEAPSAAEQWQGSRVSLEGAQELVRSGRAFVLSRPPGSSLVQQQRQPGAGTRSQGWSSWMAAAERVLVDLPEGPSYPQLRRAVVALLAEAWLAAGASWHQSEDETASRILLRLYDLHAASAVRKSAVEYYHFSKAAGTSVCVTSADMGCTTFSFSEQHTCLIPEFGDGPRWINRKAHNARCRRVVPGYNQCLTKLYTKLAKWGYRYSPRSPLVGCAERAAWLYDRGFNFYASEYTLRGRGGNVTEPPQLCSNFLNLAVLRAPQARLLSHMRYIVRITYDWMGKRTAQYMRNMSLQDWRRLVPAAFDNYYTRSLLGEEVFYTRTGELNSSTHLPAARGVLAAMDVVVVLEDSEQLLQQSHKWGLGWRKTFLQTAGRSSSHESSEVSQLAEQVLPTGAAAEELAAANSLDEQLYDYAVLLSRLDSVVWAAAEAAGVSPPEENPGPPETNQRTRQPSTYVGKGSAANGSGGGSTRGSSGRSISRSADQHRRCGYVAAVWPKPSAPPLAPNVSRSPSPPPSS